MPCHHAAMRFKSCRADSATTQIYLQCTITYELPVDVGAAVDVAGGGGSDILSCSGNHGPPIQLSPAQSFQRGSMQEMVGNDVGVHTRDSNCGATA